MGSPGLPGHRTVAVPQTSKTKGGYIYEEIIRSVTVDPDGSDLSGSHGIGI